MATAGQRDLRRCVTAYPDLFPERQFGPTLFSALAHVMAFSAPGVPADRLRIANRAGLWNFAADSKIDTADHETATKIVERCLQGPAEDDLTRFLAEIRAELAMSAELEDRWNHELQRMLAAMLTEREWIDTPPAFEEYLPVAARSIGLSWVLLTHWIATGAELEAADPEGIDEVIEAAYRVEPVLRLINDLGTYDRDLADGDVNALGLGVTHEELTARLEALMAELDLEPLRRRHPDVALFLDRQIGFNLGFYRTTDYRVAG